MYYIKTAEEVATAVDHYLCEEEGSTSGVGGRRNGRKTRRRAPVAKPLPHHSSLRIWGGGRFYRQSNDRVRYAYGAQKYVHNCDVRSFGLYDLFAAVGECGFPNGSATMAWYVNPVGPDRGARSLVPLNSDESVQMMFAVCHSVGMHLTQVYTQDVKVVLPQIHGGDLYCVPMFLPKIELPVEIEVFRAMVAAKLEVRAAWSQSEKGLLEKMGKTWYASDRQEPEPPCTNTLLNFRASP